MSRKRAVKKLQKRQESVLARLEELYLQGATEEFLALAAEQLKDPAASSLAAEWAEMADLAIRQSLAGADFVRIERLLPLLRRGGPLRPLALLAEAVLDLAGGRLEAARSRLAALAAMPGGAAALPPGLLTGVQSLAQDGLQHLPGDAPGLEAVRELFAALRSLDRQALARSVGAVRAAAPEDPGDKTNELHRLLDGVHRCLSLLADLAVLDDKLTRLPQGAEGDAASRLVTGWLRGPGPLLTAILTASLPGLPAPLRPLHHAVHLRWRAVLERVAAREGPGLIALCAADPRLLAVDVTLPGGVQAGLASLRQGVQARQLLAGRRYRDLAALLRSRSQTEPDSGALAALWSLELWTLQRRDDEDADEDDWLAEPPEPPEAQALLRLQGMAGEIGRRIPAEQRTGVARRLRDELLDLCEQAHLGEPTARAALSLLEHQPGDTGLLIAGIAGAVAGGDSKTLRSLQERLPHGQGAQGDSLTAARRMMVQVAREDPPTVARSLELLRPLFTEGVWPEIVELVAREMSRLFSFVLSAALLETAMEGPRAGDRTLADIRRQLDRLRPVLAGTPGFAAMGLTFDYCRPGPPAEESRLEEFLAAHPGLEGALIAFRLLERVASTPGAPPRVPTARGHLARAVIERLDDRWELWVPVVPALVLDAGTTHLPRLEEKIQQILASPEIQPSGRQQLEHLLQLIQRLLHRRSGRTGRRKKGPSPEPGRKKPRRRFFGTPQLQLDL